MPTVPMKRAAGDKRTEAKTRMDALRGKMEKQINGTLAEGESRMSADEITAERTAIEELIKEAKALEGVDDLQDILNRPDDQLSGGAQDVKNQIARGNGQQPDRGGRKQSVFGGLGDFLKAMRTASGDYGAPLDLSKSQKQHLMYLKSQATLFMRGEPIEDLKELGDLEGKTLVGDDPGSTGRADYLVPPEHMGELLRVMGEQQQFAQRARRIPMARRSVTFPRLVQDDNTVNRPMFSFASVTKLAEAAEKPEREPKFGQLTLNAVKYAAYLEASDELLVDSIVDLPPVLADLLTTAISYEFDRDTMRGSGNGEPLGFLTSAATLGVNRTTAGKVTLEDIFNMEARFFGTDGIYLFHQSAVPQIYALQQANIVAWNSDLTGRVPGTLLGRAMVRTAKLPILGMRGDFNLVDPSFYLVGEVQTITLANSIHYRFRNDVTSWRAVYRAAGSPWPAGTFSMEAAAGEPTWEVSPFVTLDVVAVS